MPTSPISVFENSSVIKKGVVSAVAPGAAAVALVATGTPDGTKFIRDDGVLAVPAGGGGGGGGGYTVVQEETVGVTQRGILNIVGAALTATDNAGNSSTDITLSQSPASASVVGTGRLVSTATGLSGGGDLSADRTIALDVNALTADATPVPGSDYLLEYDASASGHKKTLISAVAAVINVADLADIDSKTGSGTVVVMSNSPAITTPTIADLTGMTHTHQNAAGGGSLDAAAIGSGTVATARLGSSSATANTVLRGDQTWGKPTATALDEVIALANLTDVTAVTGTGTVVAMSASPVFTGTPTIPSFASATHTHQNSAGGGTLDAAAIAAGTMATARLGSGTADENSVLKGDQTYGDPPDLHWKRVFCQHTVNPGATTITTSGFAAAPTVNANSTVNSDTADAPHISYTTTASSGNAAGWISPSFVVARRAWNPDFAARITTAGALSAQRIWIGMMSTSLDAVQDPTTQHVAAFRYDTTADGTAFWRTVTCDGSTANVTTTTVAIAAASYYVLRIVLRSGSVKFYINGTLAATHTTNLPTTSTTLGYAARLTALAAAARTISISSLGVSY